MIFKQYFTAWSIGLLFLSSLVHAKEPSSQAFRSFWHPMYHNQRLNYCTLKTNECGKKVADAYCQLMGYQAATKNLIAYHLNSTQFIDSPTTCKKETCHGFELINCAMSLSHKPPKPYHYTQKRFVYPRINHYRIDWCYEKNKACGAPVAHSFCQQIGYMRADSFKKESQIGLTQTLGSQELCFGNQCNGFLSIVCSR